MQGIGSLGGEVYTRKQADHKGWKVFRVNATNPKTGTMMYGFFATKDGKIVGLRDPLNPKRYPSLGTLWKAIDSGKSRADEQAGEQQPTCTRWSPFHPKNCAPPGWKIETWKGYQIIYDKMPNGYHGFMAWPAGESRTKQNTIIGKYAHQLVAGINKKAAQTQGATPKDAMNLHRDALVDLSRQRGEKTPLTQPKETPAVMPSQTTAAPAPGPTPEKKGANPLLIIGGIAAVGAGAYFLTQ